MYLWCFYFVIFHFYVSHLLSYSIKTCCIDSTYCITISHIPRVVLISCSCHFLPGLAPAAVRNAARSRACDWPSSHACDPPELHNLEREWWTCDRIWRFFLGHFIAICFKKKICVYIYMYIPSKKIRKIWVLVQCIKKQTRFGRIPES